jgi:solute:Na+ symporter, SSS family
MRVPVDAAQTLRAAFRGMVAGSAGALATYALHKAGALPFASDLGHAMWGPIIAFSLDVLVSVGVSLVTQPRPVEELQGPVYGMANEQERPSARSASGAGRRRRSPWRRAC